MIIVSATDECYVPHFTTMLHSAWTHHPDAEFYVLDCGIKQTTRDALVHFAANNRILLKIIEIDTSVFSGLPEHKQYPLAIYARLLIPDLFADSIERVLYLDADAIVVGNLTRLWQTPLSIEAIAAIPDYGGLRRERFVGNDFQIEPYVNSGVLLFNLPIWRHDHLSNAILSFVRQHPNLALPDQTGISAICAGRIVLLGVEWDFMPADNDRTLKQVEPRIVHWTGPIKPWTHKDAPFGELYLHHRRQTPFPLATPPWKVHRSKPRILLNLLIGRSKYWYRFILGRRYERFVRDYLSARLVEKRRVAFQSFTSELATSDI